MSDRKRFTHLSQIEIRDIVSSFFNSGESKASIAQRLEIDHSTVHYHIKRYQKSYVEQSSVYALVKSGFRKECTHPSVKCSLCGVFQDNIRTEDRETIRELTAKLTVANRRLQAAGLYIEEESTDDPIYSIGME